jgi:hypothetical protein
MVIDRDRRHWPDPEATSHDGAGGIDGLCPDWPAPERIHAVTTLRCGGVSEAPYQSLNLGDHVGDKLASVSANRARLQRAMQLPSAPCWLSQIHGTTLVDAAQFGQVSATSNHQTVTADGSFASQAGIVCAVLTADCLPLLFCDRQGSRVAAVHAGWRGLAAGIVEGMVQTLNVPVTELLVWLGPAIGPGVFAVGPEVRAAFIKHHDLAQQAFVPIDKGHYLADLYLLARLRLQRIGIEAVYGGRWCTYSQAEDFYSFRRDGVTGRQASLIWIS